MLLLDKQYLTQDVLSNLKSEETLTILFYFSGSNIERTILNYLLAKCIFRGAVKNAKFNRHTQRKMHSREERNRYHKFAFFPKQKKLEKSAIEHHKEATVLATKVTKNWTVALNGRSSSRALFCVSCSKSIKMTHLAPTRDMLAAARYENLIIENYKDIISLT